MFKWFFMIGFISVLSADIVTMPSLGCKDEVALISMKDGFDQKAKTSPLELNVEIISKGCRIFTPIDKLHVLDYDSKDDNLATAKVLDVQTNGIYYMFRRNIRIEQPGTKNIIPLY